MERGQYGGRNRVREVWRKELKRERGRRKRK